MASPTRKLSVFSDGSLKVETPDVLPPLSNYFRIPHDVERVNVNGLPADFRYRPNLGMTGKGPVRQVVLTNKVPRPEIFRASPSQTTPIGEAHQFLWRDINPDLSVDRFCTLLGNHLAWTNETGFPGRRDYLRRRDLTAQLPSFHAPLVNGGQIVEGEMGYSLLQALRDGLRYFGDVIGRRGARRRSLRETVTGENIVRIKSLIASAPVPSAPDILPSRLWSWGVSITPRGEINYIMREGLDGTMRRVRVLWLTRDPAWLPAVELHHLPVGVLPDAHWMYYHVSLLPDVR